MEIAILPPASLGSQGKLSLKFPQMPMWNEKYSQGEDKILGHTCIICRCLRQLQLQSSPSSLLVPCSPMLDCLLSLAFCFVCFSFCHPEANAIIIIIMLWFLCLMETPCSECHSRNLFISKFKFSCSVFNKTTTKILNICSLQEIRHLKVRSIASILS